MPEVYQCPYTGKPCYDWECSECEVEKEEREWMEELERERREQ